MTTARTFLLMLGTLLHLTAYLQQTALPLAKNPARVTALLAGAEARYQKDLAALSGPNKKYLAAIYKERYELVKNLLSGNETVTDPDAEAYLSRITTEIFRGNPSIPKEDLRILFSNAYTPNAFSMGEGTIFLHAGLFHRMPDESAVAFALCHELAHYLLNHGNESIHNYVNTVYDDAFQKQLKAISKTEYGRNRQLTELALGLTFRTRRHSRQHEEAADSMALELLKKTSFASTGAISCLQVLDTAAHDRWNYALNLPQRFNFPAFPFKKSWTESGTLLFSSANEDAAESDSLQTHPDCSLRISKLEPKVESSKGKKLITDEATFEEMRRRCDAAILQGCIGNKNLSRALYFALLLTQAEPNNAYAHALVGRSLNEIYVRQKAHELGGYIELPGATQGKRYNELLHFLQNLRLSEIAALSYYYLQQWESKFGSDPVFTEALNTARTQYINQ